MGVKIAKKGVMVDRVVPARERNASQESFTDVSCLVSLSTGPRRQKGNVPMPRTWGHATHASASRDREARRVSRHDVRDSTM